MAVKKETNPMDIEEKEVEKKEVEKKIKKSNMFIYIGETIYKNDINLIKNSIIEDITKYKDIIEKYEGLNFLFIKTSDYPEIKTMLKNKNNYLHKKIKEVKKRIEGGDIDV